MFIVGFVYFLCKKYQRVCCFVHQQALNREWNEIISTLFTELQIHKTFFYFVPTIHCIQLEINWSAWWFSLAANTFMPHFSHSCIISELSLIHTCLPFYFVYVSNMMPNEILKYNEISPLKGINSYTKHSITDSIEYH